MGAVVGAADGTEVGLCSRKGGTQQRGSGVRDGWETDAQAANAQAKGLEHRLSCAFEKRYYLSHHRGVLYLARAQRW